MDKKNVSIKLRDIISHYENIDKLNKDANLLSTPMHLAPRDMAAIFLDIEKAFSLEIYDIVTKAENFTFNCILDAIMGCKECN